jgi:hypothetical protein
MPDYLLTDCLEFLGQAFSDQINKLADLERQVLDLRDHFDDTERQPHLSRTKSAAAEELMVRFDSMATGEELQAIRHRREIHPCQGGLRLIKGDDRGGIDRCLKRDLSHTEIERLHSGGNRGTFLFWTCTKCHFRLKYFVSKSRRASLLTNDDHLTFHDSRIQSSRAFLAMSHLEQRQLTRLSGSHGIPRYTCLICTLYRPAALMNHSHTFSNRDEYAKHVETAHIDGSGIPRFFLERLKIDLREGSLEGGRREVWTTLRQTQSR